MNIRSMFWLRRYWSPLVSIMLGGLLCLQALPAHAATRLETGIATGTTLLRMDDAGLNRRLNDINALGATWIRVDFSWPAIQPNNYRNFSWGMYDRVVRQAASHHLKILATLSYTPRWARDPLCASLVSPETAAQKCAPRNADEFARFARAIAIRYRTKTIRGWEIWNEPNLTGYWKTARANHTIYVDPEGYARLANVTAKQIRLYTDGVILVGGMAPMFEPRYPVGMRQSDYLARVLPHLKSNLFNGIGIHPYSWPVLPSRAAVYNAFYTVDHGQALYNLRTVMARAGWSNKEIWGTEYGASTKGVRSVTRPTPTARPDHVTEPAQAQIVKQGIDLWYKKQNVGPLFVHSDSDQWLPTRKNEGGFGLRRSDGTKKPAYNAYKAATERL